MTQKLTLLQIVKQYLNAIEQREPIEKIIDFYSSDAEQIEYPNLITKNLTKRNVSDIKRAYESGQKVLKSQTYRITHSYEVDDSIVIESIWTGVLAIPLGQKIMGDTIVANFCQIYQFKNNKIIRQINYDCFEPF